MKPLWRLGNIVGKNIMPRETALLLLDPIGHLSQERLGERT